MNHHVRSIEDAEATHYCRAPEWQLFDRKSRAIKPAKLAQTLSAFANSDGGEVAVGIEDDGSWSGFDTIEDCNGLVTAAAESLETSYYRFEFLTHADSSGYVVFISVDRHPSVVYTQAGIAYIRRSAQNNQLSGEELEQLKRSKGDSDYESTATSCTGEELANSETMIDFMINGTAFSEPAEFLSKNGLVINAGAMEARGTIAATCLFSDQPDLHLSQAAVKVYRYRTSGPAARDYLEGVPDTVTGPIIAVIRRVEDRVEEIVSKIPKMDANLGLTEVAYPTEAIHEILVNALLHRDYGIRDYVHVRIFDNRIEIESPGRLHGAVTVENILDQRSARNPKIQRIINKFPDPPNMDIGEGLNTAFEAMEKLRLAYPVIEELSDRVRVTISHEPLASPEQAIMEYARKNGAINNSQAREVTKISQERTIRRIFEGLVGAGELTREGAGRGTRYFPHDRTQD